MSDSERTARSQELQEELWTQLEKDRLTKAAESLEELDIETARCFIPLLEPRRYKGARGGRGAAKSHFVAEKLIEDCSTGHHRVACLREYQSSIAESSMQLLKDKIRRYGLDDIFQSTLYEIRGPYESLIIFKGLQASSASSLKSLEGYSRAWVEEAQVITRTSLEMMTPTFRSTPGMIDEPEMYFTWNPIGEDDPVEMLFEQGKINDPDFVCVTVNYYDNPWFPADLRRDMERDKRRDPDKYAHVWLGQYQQISEARVFRNYVVQEFESDPEARYFFGADWGFAIDPTVLVRCYTSGRVLFIDQEAYMVGCEIDNTPKLFRTIEGSQKWPIRADSARPETIDYMKRHGFPNITAAVKGKDSILEGIEFLKSFDIIIHPRCVHTIDEFSKYSYKVDKRTGDVLPVLADANNHVIDSCRYALEGERLAPGLPNFSPEFLSQIRSTNRNQSMRRMTANSYNIRRPNIRRKLI